MNPRSVIWEKRSYGTIAGGEAVRGPLFRKSSCSKGGRSTRGKEQERPEKRGLGHRNQRRNGPWGPEEREASAGILCKGG